MKESRSAADSMSCPTHCYSGPSESALLKIIYGNHFVFNSGSLITQPTEPTEPHPAFQRHRPADGRGRGGDRGEYLLHSAVVERDRPDVRTDRRAGRDARHAQSGGDRLGDAFLCSAGGQIRAALAHSGAHGWRYGLLVTRGARTHGARASRSRPSSSVPSPPASMSSCPLPRIWPRRRNGAGWSAR